MMNGDDFFYELRTSTSTLLKLERVSCFPPPSEPVVSFFSLVSLNSTRVISEKKVSVSVEQRIIIKFRTEEGSNHEKFFRGSKNSLQKDVSLELECSNGVKLSEREQQWRPVT